MCAVDGRCSELGGETTERRVDAVGRFVQIPLDFVHIRPVAQPGADPLLKGKIDEFSVANETFKGSVAVQKLLFPDILHLEKGINV